EGEIYTSILRPMIGRCSCAMDLRMIYAQGFELFSTDSERDDHSAVCVRAGTDRDTGHEHAPRSEQFCHQHAEPTDTDSNINLYIHAKPDAFADAYQHAERYPHFHADAHA